MNFLRILIYVKKFSIQLSNTTGEQPHYPLAALDISTLIFINMTG